MIGLLPLICLFLTIFSTLAIQIRPSLHRHNGVCISAFVQDDNDIQYFLENIPIPINHDFSNSMSVSGDAVSDDNNANLLSYVSFDPPFLDFKERELGIPHQKTVILYNKDHNKTIQLSSISGHTRHFHSSFLKEEVVPPLGNTTFNVAFLGREEGEIDTHLFIHTLDGIIKYQVKGISIGSPYRLRPVVDVKLPLNASFTPLIYMHNPHPDALQVIEVYSSGGEFQLELPTGDAEGPRELWEIPPYQTKPIIRLYFNAYAEKNHTAYMRFKVNNSADILVIAVEVEVKSRAGLHWGGSSGVINLGLGGSLQPPIHYPIALKNSAKKPIKVVNIVSTPVSKALKLNFEPAVIPGDTDTPVAIGSLIYDWKIGLDLQHFKGKLMIKGIGPGGSSQKLAIPWIAQVLPGGLEVNASITHYCSPQSNQPRNFSVVNKFKSPLAITNVTMSSNAKSFFAIKNFSPRIIKPEEKVNIFLLQLTKERKNENMKMESSILIHTNVSVTEVPLLSYDGKVRRIIPGERARDGGVMNFGTVGSGTENEAVFALENQNPVNIELQGWGVNMPGAVLELMGCYNGPGKSFDKVFQNITVCSYSGNQFIKPGFLAIFKIKVKTSTIEEDTMVGDVFVKTTYERFTLPVFMRVAHGKISLKKLIFTDCFPGSICVQQVKVHSTFSRPMQVASIKPIKDDDRIKYIPLEEATLPIISKGDNHIGSVRIDPTVICKQHCYLGLSLETNAGNQWLNTMSLPSHARDSDLNLLTTRYERFLNSTKGGNWDNITMCLDTSEVRGHKFGINIKSYWPSLLINSANLKNGSLTFPLTQIGNTSYKTIKLHNPSTNPIFVQLVMDWNYPQGARLYHSLPNKFKRITNEGPSTVPNEFKLEDALNEGQLFNKQWNVMPASNTFPLYLNSSESRIIRLSYTPSSDVASSAILFVRNNMTILEVLRLKGRGAHAQFKFGNRKPGSVTPLLFELTENHLKDCDVYSTKRDPIPNLTVKRSFTARNTGELPVEVYGFYINGLNCEGYGFKVLSCSPFKLYPNTTKRIEIAFTPDFTLSRIERQLLILTSLGGDIVELNLLATLPPNSLRLCSAILIRPVWEYAIKLVALSLSSILLSCVFAISFLEAERILRGALDNFSRGNFVQPILDLRLLSQGQNNANKEKLLKKEDCVVVKKNKDKSNLKMTDWSVEEERKFRLDKKYVKKQNNATEIVVNRKQKIDNTPSKIEAVKKSVLKKKDKNVQLSEEESSSTGNEDQPLFVKSDKVQRKISNKKSQQQQPQTNLNVPSVIDYKDNYEGDCDDDDYDKDKRNNLNRWKTSTPKSNSKHHQQSRASRSTDSTQLRSNKAIPKKEKSLPKRRIAEKNTNSIQNEGTKNPVSLPPPPLSSCWGENRAKFSDVVARNQENTSTLLNKSAEIGTVVIEKDVVENNDSIFETNWNPQCSNSYFINTFRESLFEPELVPYEDFPESDELLVELETPEEDTRSQFWENHHYFDNGSRMDNNSLTGDSSDILRDNWSTVGNNWEPLYTRTAVGEERNGIWGINKGGVWAAAPWGAAPPLANSESSFPSAFKNVEREKSGFDPFHSLSTIWTPSTSEFWKKKHKD